MNRKMTKADAEELLIAGGFGNLILAIYWYDAGYSPVAALCATAFAVCVLCYCMVEGWL